MHFLKALTLTILPTALASPILLNKRQSAEAVTDAIANIETGIGELTTALNDFQGGLFNLQQVLAVQRATGDLGNDIDAATSAAAQSPDFDDNQSLAVGLAILNLEPQIGTLLDLLESKAGDFDRVGGVLSVRSTVRQSLVDQRDKSAEFGAAVTEKLTPAFAALAPEINARIADRFNQAIAVFEQQGSGIPLPPLPSFPFRA